MDQRSVRVVVGQGDPTRGALRDVLEDDGFEVIGEAAVGADLARILRSEQPDVVVLDDAIGVAAAQLVAELAPRAKLVVIWPAGVVPIGGATRVDPGEVTMALSATVGLVAGIELSGLVGTIDRPDWIEKIRKDPATLRDKLAMGAAVPARPSVTELQRRGERLHPSMGMGRRRRPRPAGDAAMAAAVLLPIAPAADIDATLATTGVEDPAEATLNRRIGMIALGGAAVAGALMIALSFGSHRQPPVLAAGPFLPPLAAPTFDPPTTPVDGSSGPSAPTTPPTTGPTTTGGGATTASGTSTGPAGGSSGSGSSGGGQTAGGPGVGGPLTGIAGASAANNPHGGPPGLLRLLDATGVASAHAGGHTPRGAHPEHPAHPVHTHKQ